MVVQVHPAVPIVERLQIQVRAAPAARVAEVQRAAGPPEVPAPIQVRAAVEKEARVAEQAEAVLVAEHPAVPVVGVPQAVEPQVVLAPERPAPERTVLA